MPFWREPWRSIIARNRERKKQLSVESDESVVEKCEGEGCEREELGS